MPLEPLEVFSALLFELASVPVGFRRFVVSEIQIERRVGLCLRAKRCKRCKILCIFFLGRDLQTKEVSRFCGCRRLYIQQTVATECDLRW